MFFGYLQLGMYTQCSVLDTHILLLVYPIIQVFEESVSFFMHRSIRRQDRQGWVGRHDLVSTL